MKHTNVKHNDPLLVKTENGVNLLFSDFQNSDSKIIRRVDLINSKNNSMFESFYIVLETTDGKNLNDELKSRNLSGNVTILDGNTVLIKCSIVNGKYQSFKRVLEKSNIKNYVVKAAPVFMNTYSRNITTIKKANRYLASSSVAVGTSYEILDENLNRIASSSGLGVSTMDAVYPNEVLQNQSIPPGCNITTVHDCVSYKIEDMNPIEYGLCLASAPTCYAGIWAACIYDVCYDGKVYVNPIGN